MAETDRLQVYAYATAPEAADYVEIMRRFTSGLLAEWSARDLVERGLDLRLETVDARLRFLAAHGNLIESPREVRVTSIAEYQRQPARYAVSATGALVQRQVEEVLAAAGGAREVPRELLDAVASGIDRLIVGVSDDALAGRELAELVTTIFLQFEAFATAIADFYSYVGAVLARPDLDGDEWLGFKGLLLDYLETIVESVAVHTPGIRRGVARLERVLDRVLARVDAADPDLDALRAMPGAGAIARARGRTRADWDGLRAWFGDAGDREAGAAQLRAAAGRAVGTLLVQLKRLNAAGSREESMRRHLLRLAGWFETSSPADAHDLFTAAFGLYGARHLGVVLDDELASVVPATASWWTAPSAPVPVSLVERGDRTARGRTTRAADHSAQRALLLEERRRADAARRAAIAELAAAADRLTEVRLSADAFALVLELLAAAAADRKRRTGRLVDDTIELHLAAAPGATAILRSAAGSLTLHDQYPVMRVAGATVASRSEAGA